MGLLAQQRSKLKTRLLWVCRIQYSPQWQIKTLILRHLCHDLVTIQERSPQHVLLGFFCYGLFHRKSPRPHNWGVHLIFLNNYKTCIKRHIIFLPLSNSPWSTCFFTGFHEQAVSKYEVVLWMLWFPEHKKPAFTPRRAVHWLCALAASSLQMAQAASPLPRHSHPSRCTWGGYHWLFKGSWGAY